MEEDSIPIESSVRLIDSSQKCDLYIHFGPLSHISEELFFSESETVKHKTAILLLSTYGGSPGAAYRIARRLKQQYESFSVFVFSKCKSAGTLLSIGADEIIMADSAEMGPLDIQLRKTDELNEMSSGLTINQAMASLRNEAFSMFEEYFLRLRVNSNNQISTKRAAEIATKITVGLLNPIYSQIDPLQLGETDRALSITQEYGQRLKSSNLKDGTIETLIAAYPDHGFVIDREEAKTLFKNVRKPNENETQLIFDISNISKEFLTKRDPLVLNLTNAYTQTGEGNKIGEENNDNKTECEQIDGKTSLGDSKNIKNPGSETEDILNYSKNNFTDGKG